MSTDTWGLLPKNQEDNEKIEEAISRLIAEHEADPEAHTGENESLEAHRASEILDHLKNSVVDDKIRIDRFSIKTNFESITGLSCSAGVFSYIGYLELATTSSLNNNQYAYLPSDDHFEFAPDLVKNPIFESVSAVSSNGDYIAYLGIGEPGDSGVGFKIVNGVLSAYWIDDEIDENLIEIASIDPEDQLHKYRVEVYDGESVLWFVDNVQKAQLDLTTNTLNNFSGRIFHFDITTKEAGEVAKLASFRVLYEQDFIDF